MITPTFKLDQNNDYLFIQIKTPFAKLTDLDIFVFETDFRFYCKPYFLRLNLPADILENEDEDVNYDFDERMFKLKYKKKNSGEHFEGLDLLTKLLTPDCAPSKLASNLIEEIEDSTETVIDDDNEEAEDEIQWYIDQKVSTEEDDCDISLNGFDIKYGFAQTKSKVFSKLGSEYEMIVDLPEPDTNTKSRREQRMADENKRFNDDHYLADYFDDSEIIESHLLTYKPTYKNPEMQEYTEAEMDTLKNLPKKKYILDTEQKFHAYSGLVDILFAYCYTDRINCGEANVESGWTISKISSTLSWFDTFTSLDDVILTAFRRSLSIPLYRNWKLSLQVFEDLKYVLRQGHRLILKCLLSVRSTFIDTENRYLLNDLYINDYCVWIQYASKKKLEALVQFLEKIEITKEMMGFDLDCLELVANEQVENGYSDDNDTDDSEDESSDDDEDGDSSSNISDNDQVAREFELKLSLDSAAAKKKPLIEMLD